MLSRQKLHTFIFRDKFQLSVQEVLAEAHEAALRHAELMGWTDVEVVDSSVSPTKQGEYICYSFDIWGIGESTIDPAGNHQELTNDINKQGQVAKEAGL